MQAESGRRVANAEAVAVDVTEAQSKEVRINFSELWDVVCDCSTIISPVSRKWILLKFRYDEREKDIFQTYIILA